MTSQKPVTVCNRQSGLYADTFWHTLRTMKLKATTDCPGNLTSEMHKASPNITASGSSLHYFAHIVKVKFVLTHLLAVLTKHDCQHNIFWGCRCVNSHAPTISLKPVLFKAISALNFSASTPVLSEHTSSLANDLPK